MVINQKQMDEINAIQMEIFRAFHNACEQLHLNYYLVHGSLLGALRHQGFFPMDDDIDVAMPRKDYDILMKKGQELIDKKYFIQSNLSEADYPLVFAKVRDNGTAFIQPILRNFDVNQGIYIDIFPIDNYPSSKWKQSYLKRIGWLYNLRVNMRFHPEHKGNVKSNFLHSLATFLNPSWNKARDKYNNLYSKCSYTGKVIVRGGKGVEVNIPFDLFGNPSKIKFEDIESYAPEQTSDYLKLIYGDYMNYEPMGKDMVSDTEVKISAEILDTANPYTKYIK